MTGLVSVAGKEISFPCGDGASILDAAEVAGFAMPYSCRKGVCATCTVRLITGTVRQRAFGAVIPSGNDVLSCAVEADGDVVIDAPSIVRRSQPDRITSELTVHRIRPLSKDVVALHLRLPIGRRLNFVAGQYVRVLLPEGDSRNYSIANPPHLNDEIELHVRQVSGGLFSDHVLRSLRLGSSITVEAPYGLFSWSEEMEAPAIMLATGTGFAPLKSMIQELIHKCARKPVHLFWGGAAADDLYALSLAERWASEFDWFDFTPVLAAPNHKAPGPTGFVQDVVADWRSDLTTYEVYACGNPLMIASAREKLAAECGLNNARFHADAFVFSGNFS